MQLARKTLTLPAPTAARYGRVNVTGRLADFFRFAWALLYWNARKSIFRLRRGRGRCPCQNPSDSGRAHETGCDAAVGWHRPARFRRVCPLLEAGPDGVLRCSANAADVRPFWGRAGAFYGGAALTFYLAATLATFAALRAIGYPVSYHTVAWPPAWSRIADARAEYFRRKAHAAYAAKRYHEATLALSQAYELAPHDHASGLLLAQLWQTSQPTLSNRIYARLLRDHPDRWDGTAQAWLRALLARGDHAVVAQVSAEGVRRDPEHALAWAHALSFATRHTGDLAPLQAALDRAETLPLPARTVLTLEQTVHTTSPEEARTALRTFPAGEAQAVGLFRARRLVELGFAAEALELLDRLGVPLEARDGVAVRLDAYAALGYTRPAENLVAALLRGPLTPALADVLGAHLIRHPNRPLYNQLFDRFDRAALPRTPEGMATGLALFCIAGTYDDEPRLRATAAEIERILGTEFAALAAVQRFFLRRTPEARIESYLPLLQPLSIELTYALLDRFAPPRGEPHR